MEYERGGDGCRRICQGVNFDTHCVYVCWRFEELAEY